MLPTEGAEPPDRARRSERLLWHLGDPDRPLLLDIQPPVIGRQVQVFVNGRDAGSLRRPDLRHPWSTLDLDAGGHRYTIALTPGIEALHTEVFRDGASVLDGRSIAAAELDAPRPITRFEAFVGVPAAEAPLRPLAPRWVVIAASVFVLMLLVSVVIYGGLLAAALFATGSAGLSVLYFRTWLTGLTHLEVYLLSKPEWGDAGRLAVFAAAVVGIPILGALAFIAFMVLAGPVSRLITTRS